MFVFTLTLKCPKPTLAKCFHVYISNTSMVLNFTAHSTDFYGNWEHCKTIMNSLGFVQHQRHLCPLYCFLFKKPTVQAHLLVSLPVKVFILWATNKQLSGLRSNVFPKRQVYYILTTIFLLTSSTVCFQLRQCSRKKWPLELQVPRQHFQQKKHLLRGQDPFSGALWHHFFHTHKL